MASFRRICSSYAALFFRPQQTELRRRDFVQQPLRFRAVFTRLKRPQQHHPLIGGVLDNVRAGFKRSHAQQPVMIRRLLVERNTQPLVIRVEGFGHDGTIG